MMQLIRYKQEQLRKLAEQERTLVEELSELWAKQNTSGATDAREE